MHPLRTRDLPFLNTIGHRILPSLKSTHRGSRELRRPQPRRPDHQGFLRPSWIVHRLRWPATGPIPAGSLKSSVSEHKQLATNRTMLESQGAGGRATNVPERVKGRPCSRS